ncbi:MAG TPA: NAD(P)-dependent oxidoreductase [Burkholderiales bacterium]|nr:NAD(P)-dependent oxidoreductase [Burkholderiales bacterium]
METLGFIGLGVMGEPMCRNLARKSGCRVLGYDLSPAPLERLAADGVRPARTAREIAERTDVVLLSLPSGAEVEAVCAGDSGLVALARAGQAIVDLGTSPVALARSLAAGFAARGAAFADAPVARTREAAIAGTLSVMVGADVATFGRIQPLLATMASEVTHCGEPGAGQLVKLLNNMVLAQTVVALAEALATARRSGVDAKLVFEALAKGSADSFALRNHGMKALLPGAFPERAFSAEYMLKDLRYALIAAREAGVELRGARNAHDLLEATVAAGYGKEYWPALYKIVDGPA